MTGGGKLVAQIGKIVGALGDPNNIADAGNFVRDAAVMLAPVQGGTLRTRIQMMTYEEDDGTHVAEVFTNMKYAHYVEFGTGPKGAANHVGISPEVNPVYTPWPWWIHESQLDIGVAEMYHWHYIDTPSGRFYICYGQAAQPFMYPALKDNEQIVLDILKDGYNEAMRRASR